MKPKAKVLPRQRLYHIKRAGGGTEILCIPPGARLTIYAGKVVGPQSGELGYSRGTLPNGGQLRVYKGNQLIGFFPDVLELHEIDSISLLPHTLGQHKDPQPHNIGIGLEDDTAKSSIGTLSTFYHPPEAVSRMFRDLATRTNSPRNK